MQSDVDILASARLFEDLPRPALERLAERTQHRHFDAGEGVFNEGDPGAALYIVAEGEVRIDIASPAGEKVTLVFLGPGEAFGELALLDNAPRSADAVATEATTLLSLYRKDFFSILEGEPEAARALVGTLAGYVRSTNQRLADAAFLDVPGRMAKALKTLADRYGKETPDGILLDHELTPSDFAGLTGLHESFVRKLLQDYQYDSVLMVDDGRITIHRPEVLDRWLQAGS